MFMTRQAHLLFGVLALSVAAPAHAPNAAHGLSSRLLSLAAIVKDNHAHQ